MDGASKFVRGDAIASILILVINLIGGVAIGSLMHDLPLGESFRQYALLTIGDGLVSQIPALLLSASAVIVTRISDADAGEFPTRCASSCWPSPRCCTAPPGDAGAGPDSRHALAALPGFCQRAGAGRLGHGQATGQASARPG
jgi:flagellar biosynthesis protein FlhA